MTENNIEYEIITSWEDKYISIEYYNLLIDKLLSDENSKFKKNDTLFNSCYSERYITIQDFLKKEIKKIYNFYQQVEKDLYHMTNTHILNKQNSEHFSLVDIYYELCMIKETSELCYSLVDYVNANLFLLGNIPNSYSDKISDEEGVELNIFLTKEIFKKDTDLNYIYQLRIVDEVSLVIERLIEYYKVLYKNKNNSHRNSIKKKRTFCQDANLNTLNIIISDKTNNNIKEDKNKDNQEINKKDLESLSNNEIKDNINEIIITLIGIIDGINCRSLDFRFDFNNEFTFQPIRNKKLFTCSSKLSSNKRKALLNNNIRKNNTIEKSQVRLLKQESLKELIRWNFIIIYFYVIIHQLFEIFTLIYLFKIISTKTIRFYLETYLFIYVGKILNIFINRKLLSYSTKLSLIFNNLLIIISSFLFIFYTNSILKHQIVLYISNFLIGFTSIGIYLKEYLSKNINNQSQFLISNISLMYHFSYFFGLGLGTLLSFLVYYFLDSSQIHIGKLFFSKINIIYLLLFFSSLILIIFNLVKFTDDDEKESEIQLSKGYEGENKEILIKIDNDLGKINDDKKYATTNLLYKEVINIVNEEIKLKGKVFNSFKLLTITLTLIKGLIIITILHSSLFFFSNKLYLLPEWKISLIYLCISFGILFLLVKTFNISFYFIILIFAFLLISLFIITFICFIYEYYTIYLFTFPTICILCFLIYIYLLKLLSYSIPKKYIYFPSYSNEEIIFLSNYISFFIFNFIIYLIQIIFKEKFKFEVNKDLIINTNFIVFSISLFIIFLTLIYFAIKMSCLKQSSLVRVINFRLK